MSTCDALRDEITRLRKSYDAAEDRADRAVNLAQQNSAAAVKLRRQVDALTTARDAAVARAAAAEAALARAYEHAEFQAAAAPLAAKKAWQRQMDLCRFDAATEGPRP